MQIAFIAMSGVRAASEELNRIGMTLPGFVERSEVVHVGVYNGEGYNFDGNARRVESWALVGLHIALIVVGLVLAARSLG